MNDFEKILEKSIIKLARKEKAQNIKKLQDQMTNQSKLNNLNKLILIFGIAASFLLLIYIGVFNTSSDNINDINISDHIQVSDSNNTIVDFSSANKYVRQKANLKIATDSTIFNNSNSISEVIDTLEKVANTSDIANLYNTNKDQNDIPMSSSKSNTVSRFVLKSILQVLDKTKIVDSSKVKFTFQNGTSKNYIAFEDSIIINIPNIGELDKLKSCYIKSENIITSWIDNNGIITIDTRGCIGNYIIVRKQ